MDVINVYKRFLLKNKKTHFNVFILLTLFLFWTQKSVKLLFPVSSSISNVLTINDNGI